MLTIADFEANYYLPEGAPDRTAIRPRLDRLVHHRLPAEMGGHLRLPPTDEGAVFRIRHLEVDLWIDALAMSDGEITRHWSRVLLQAVARALLYGLPSQVVRYDDHAHFLATFLGDLLAGQAWSHWAYDEFAPLRDLPPGQVAAHLLAPRPALLVPVARRLAGSRQLEPLLQRLRAPDVHLIWERGLGFGEPATVPAPGDLLDQILDALHRGVPLEHGGPTARARNALRLYLAAAMARPGLEGHAVLGAVCHHLALLHQMWTARPVAALWTAMANLEIASPAAIAPVLASQDRTLAPAHDWLKAALVTPAGQTYLAQLVPIVVPDVRVTVAAGQARTTKDGRQVTAVGQVLTARDAQQPAAEGQARTVEGIPQSIATGQAPTASREQRAASARVQQAATAFAGLALLLPVIRDLAVHESLPREGLYQLLLAVVGRAHQPLAGVDAGPAWLAGVPAPETERVRDLPVSWPDVARWTDAEALTQAAERAVAHLGPPPGSVVALLVLQQFARGLRGFADSSPAYLAKQFINLPGHLYLTDGAIETYLSRAPLGIVLQMAGWDGDQGPIPWLNDRHLWIHLPG